MMVALLMAGGCGGDGGGTGGVDPPPPAANPPPPPLPPTRSIGGLWSGGLSWEPRNGLPGGAVNVRGLVAETGEFHWVLAEPSEEFFGSRNEQIFGTLTFDDTTVGTRGEAIWVGLSKPPQQPGAHWGYFELFPGVLATPDRLSGTFQSGWTISEKRVGRFELGYHSLYQRASSLETLQGTFGTDTESLTIDEHGFMFYQSSQNGCIGIGQAAVIDPNFNMYRLKLDTENCKGSEASRNGLTFSGLADLGVNNDAGGGFINETLEIALTASSVDGLGIAYYEGWTLLAHRK
jgi:hypothetical protein